MRVQDFTSGVAGLRSTGRAVDGASHEAFVRIKHELDRLQARVESLETFQLAVTRQLAGAGVYIKTFVVVADMTVPHPEEPAGSVIIYAFLMDAVGGWTVTFPATFKGLYPDHIDPTASTLSSIIMYKTLPDQLEPIAFGASGVILT